VDKVNKTGVDERGEFRVQSEAMKTIMGIDPGTYRTGYGVIRADDDGQMVHVAHGVIEMHSDFYGRLLDLGRSLEKLLVQWQPQSVVVEKIFLGKNVDSIFKLGHARGIILYEAQKSGASLVEYATRSVKKGVAGHGGAEKVDVQAAVQFYLRIPKIASADASDALAMAIFHGQQNQKQQLLKRAEFL
jgi:crossover junction endodeoxyribonuclease RuvC